MTIEKSRFNSEAAPHLNNSQTDILIMRNYEPRIDSRLFADHVGIKHKNLYALIKSHKTQLRELGTLPFQTETCAHDTGETFAALMSAAPMLGATHAYPYPITRTRLQRQPRRYRDR